MKKRVREPVVESPVQPEPTIAPPPPPHPLTLNRNEGRWFNICVGPCDGWFSCGDHGNPPFDVPVQICLGSPIDKQGPLTVGVGIRTREISSEIGKERWQVFCQFPMLDFAIMYWRPLSDQPMPGR